MDCLRFGGKLRGSLLKGRGVASLTSANPRQGDAVREDQQGLRWAVSTRAPAPNRHEGLIDEAILRRRPEVTSDAPVAVCGTSCWKNTRPAIRGNCRTSSKSQNAIRMLTTKCWQGHAMRLGDVNVTLSERTAVQVRAGHVIHPFTAFSPSIKLPPSSLIVHRRRHR